MCCLFGLFDYGGFLSDLQKNRTLSALAKSVRFEGLMLPESPITPVHPFIFSKSRYPLTGFDFAFRTVLLS